MVELRKATNSEFYILDPGDPRSARFGFLYASRVPQSQRGSTVDLEAAWNEQTGYFAFFPSAYTDEHPVLNQWRSILERFEDPFGDSPVMAWVRRPSEGFERELGIESDDDRRVRSTVRLFFQDYSLSIERGTPISVGISGFTFGGAQSLVRFEKDLFGSVPFSSSTLTLPVTGEDADRFVGELELIRTSNGTVQLDVLDIGCRYFFPSSGIVTPAKQPLAGSDVPVTSHRFCPFDVPHDNAPIHLELRLDYFRPLHEAATYLGFAAAQQRDAPEGVEHVSDDAR